jgi:hypothetical protein
MSQRFYWPEAVPRTGSFFVSIHNQKNTRTGLDASNLIYLDY